MLSLLNMPEQTRGHHNAGLVVSLGVAAWALQCQDHGEVSE